MPVNARLVAAPSSAPESMPRDREGRAARARAWRARCRSSSRQCRLVSRSPCSCSAAPDRCHPARRGGALTTNAAHADLESRGPTQRRCCEWPSPARWRAVNSLTTCHHPLFKERAREYEIENLFKSYTYEINARLPINYSVRNRRLFSQHSARVCCCTATISVMPRRAWRAPDQKRDRRESKRLQMPRADRSRYQGPSLASP